MTTVLTIDDSALFCEGLIGLLERQGYEIVGQEHRTGALLATVAELARCDALSDVVIIDMRTPPTMTNDGLRAAVRIREDHPRVTVLVLSQYVSPLRVQELLALPVPSGAGGAGYFLKDRVTQIADFIGALQMVVGGGVVIDPEVAQAMMQAFRFELREFTPRELKVMELMTRGLSNSQIVGRFFLSGVTVAKHVPSILSELGFEPGDEDRRMRTILTSLNCPMS